MFGDPPDDLCWVGMNWDTVANGKVIVVYEDDDDVPVFFITEGKHYDNHFPAWVVIHVYAC